MSVVISPKFNMKLYISQSIWVPNFVLLSSIYSVLPRPFSEGGTPCRFLVTPCPFQEAEMTPCPFLGDAQRRPVTFYLTPNVTVHGNRRGNYAARTFPLFYSTAFVIVIRLVYKNLRYWPIRIYFGRLAIDCCINFIQ